jgi:hypothetical protein
LIRFISSTIESESFSTMLFSLIVQLVFVFAHIRAQKLDYDPGASIDSR